MCVQWRCANAVDSSPVGRIRDSGEETVEAMAAVVAAAVSVRARLLSTIRLKSADGRSSERSGRSEAALERTAAAATKNTRVDEHDQSTLGDCFRSQAKESGRRRRRQASDDDDG